MVSIVTDFDAFEDSLTRLGLYLGHRELVGLRPSSS